MIDAQDSCAPCTDELPSRCLPPSTVGRYVVGMHNVPVSSPHARALLSGAIATLVLTSVHHVYGAFRYDTPWRNHAAFISLFVIVALVVAFAVYRRGPATRAGGLAGWGLIVLSVVFAVLVFGAFEGGYNHVLKDLLFLVGAPAEWLTRLFPPPKYEMPNDLVFEVTGVLQVVPAAFTALAALRFGAALRGGTARARHAWEPQQ